MKRLLKKKKNNDTIEAYCKCADCVCGCFCSCSCGTCGGSQTLGERTMNNTFDNGAYNTGNYSWSPRRGANITGI